MPILDREYLNKQGRLVRVFKSTPEEIKAHAGLERRAEVLAQIAELEDQITPRRMREAVLGTDGGFMRDLEAKISRLRASLI